MFLRRILFFLLIWVFQVQADPKPFDVEKFRWPHYVITKNSFGMIGGIERGKHTFLELGLEAHWKKYKLRKAPTLAINANMEYNFKYNVLGYNACVWFKIGRVALTYGLNFNYITDFDSTRLGLGPQIGFRLLGFHLVNGYNFLFMGDKTLKANNTFYIGLRYYFPLDAKTRIRNKNK